MLTTRIIHAEWPKNTIPHSELDFFIKGDFSLDDGVPIKNPHTWITPTGWKDLLKLTTVFKASDVN